MQIRNNPKVIATSAAVMILSTAASWFLLFSGFVADALDSNYTALIFTLFFLANVGGVISGIVFLFSMAWCWPFRKG